MVILQAVYEATLTVAAIFAIRRGERVKVYLTAVGGGMLGNRSAWIADAIDKALCKLKDYPLDVMLVHYAELPKPGTPYEKFEKTRHNAKMTKTANRLSRSVTNHLDCLGL